ncbi:MAG: SUMF1/EgtB/PvdO family nonheme iron enzyme [Treponema sp.]|jgi:hypothetical protein|nr:SUMF1/EgtB/PvdO family nonheme iron enzyme [Treponema sp.]
MFGKSGKDTPEPEDRVTLPPLLGIRPGIYLAVLYGAALLTVLFFLLLYPGITKPGSLGIFSSEPEGAAVRIDGVTLGTTPCELFIPKGKHTVEMVLPGFGSHIQEAEIGGRIFGSKFFPSRRPLTGTLTSGNPLKALATEAASFARWSLAIEPTESWQIPQDLSEGVYRTGPALRSAGNLEEAERILETALGFASTRASLRDLLRAKFLLDNGGLSPSPLTLLGSLTDAAALLENTPGAASWLAEVLSGGGGAELAASAWHEKNSGPSPQAGAGRAQTAAEDTPSPLGPALNLEGLDFLFIPGGNLIRPGRRDLSIPSLWAASGELSLAAWEAFTAENPQWGADRREKLADGGLVREDYLLDPGFGAYPYPAAPGISWYAAAAYCAWLTEKLPPPLKDAGLIVRLPTEEEWEFAALHTAETPNGSFMGGLWEWCENTFVPLDFFSPNPAVLELIAGTDGEGPSGKFPLERSVRGGSWINVPGSINPETRASLPPDTSSPFVGFRPFIAPRSNGK